MKTLVIEHDKEWLRSLSNHGGTGKEPILYPLDAVEDSCMGYAEHMQAKDQARIAELEEQLSEANMLIVHYRGLPAKETP